MEKHCLARMEACYSLACAQLGGRDVLLAASENRSGDAVAIDRETRQAYPVRGLAGGVMNIVPIPWEADAFLAIQRFYPVFCSQEAEIVRFRLRRDGDGYRAETTVVQRLPFVHRIALCGSAAAPRLIASTLCGGKSAVDDWSQPGAVYALFLDGECRRVEKTQPLAEGLHRNHGLYAPPGGSHEPLLFSADEGVFALDTETLRCRKLLDAPVSDVFPFDLDGDGTQELAAITPFHGDTLEIFRQSGGAYVSGGAYPTAFGHAVWCGKIGAGSAVILCGRGGDRSTVLLRTDAGLRWTSADVLDAGVGAANIQVVSDGGRTVLYACNHAAGEIAEYTL